MEKKPSKRKQLINDTILSIHSNTFMWICNCPDRNNEKYKMKQNHIWCNGVNPLKAGPVSDEEVDNCQWCGGDKGLHKNYPIDKKTEEDLIKEYFPNVKKVN